MKKLLLILSLVCISFTAFAADLNPFAYNLNSEYNEHAQTLTINFTLNAPASYVKLAISNGTSDVWIKEYKAADYQAGQVPKATYTETINTLTLPQGENLTWRVDVKGAAVAQPTFAHNKVKLDRPTSIDIDNNPENENFGTVFVVEALPTGKGNSKFISKDDGAGLYILNADGTARPMPNRPAGKYGYNGGRVKQTRQYFNEDKSSCFSPYRVRVSDDGRIFISSMNIDGEVLWEADPLVFSRPDAADWEARAIAGWSRVMSVENENTYMATKRRNCSHTDCGIYSLYEGNAETGTFIAGPNIGFDVRGSGDALKLLMLAGCKDAIVNFTMGHYYCDEYDLGTATMWNTPPSRRVFKGYVVNYSGAQVQYDGDGNVWLCQHRAQTDTARTLAKFINADNGKVNIAYDENPKKMYRRCGAIRFNEDFTQVVIASNANPKAGNTSGGGFTVYPFDSSTGEPVWDQGLEVNTKAYTHFSLMDFAWDYAGNLYIAADAADGSAGDCIAIYAMPHAADRVVSTPAASKYAFTVNCKEGAEYQVTTICYPSEAGTITCSVGGNTRAAGVMTVASCTELTVTATPEDGYKFLNWTDGNGNILSTETEYSLYVTENITLQANFEYATYTGIVWKSLFMDGQDIADENPNYPNTNERLWRLLQVEFNKYYTGLSSGNNARGDYPDHTSANTDKTYTKNKKQFNTAPFLNVTGNTNFFKGNVLFSWLGEYIDQKASRDLSNSDQPKTDWTYYPYLFINRTDSVYNWPDSSTGGLANYVITGTKQNPRTWDSFITYGKPEHWRPYWAEHVCNLPMTMKYSDYMPILSTWTRPDCPSGYITKNGTSTKIYPSSWYIWNIPANNPATQDLVNKKYFVLAWRKGSPTAEEIVHHVYEPNMELHASYVDAHLQEEDPTPDLTKDPYDATNNDVLSLLNNKNYGATAHNVTMDRKFAGGMYNTICLPFDLPISHLPDELKNADIRVFNSVTETYTESGDPVAVLNFITLDEYWDNWNTAHPDKKVADENRYMEAGRAYLIKPAADVNDPYLTYSGLPYWRFFDGTRMPYGTYADYVSFQGVLNPTTLPENSYILVADNRLAKVTNTSDKILGYRGYFVIDDAFLRSMADQGNLYFSFQKPVTTSIPMAPEAEQQTKPEVRKIMYDGKIYILRGDEVYTITGHRVK